MSAKLKKRSWGEFLGEDRSDHRLIITGKTVLTEDGDHSRIELHLNNLLAIFPDIEEEIVRKVYSDANKDIDTTLTELERMQGSRNNAKQSPTKQSKQTEDRLQDQGHLEAELRNEMNGLDHFNDRALQRLKNNASLNINQAIDDLGKCKSKEEAKQVLENLLSYTLGETLEVNQSQIERLKAQYMIAKQAVHMQNNQISRKDKENAVLRKMNSKYYDDWKNLAELNKQMLRELEDASNYKTRGSPFGPNHDVY